MIDIPEPAATTNTKREKYDSQAGVDGKITEMIGCEGEGEGGAGDQS